MSHRVTRALWMLTWTVLARWTPAPLHGWRRFLLRLFGARIASTAKVYPSARIWYPRNLKMMPFACLGRNTNCYCMADVVLESYALVSEGAFLCGGTHDVDDPNFQLVACPIRLCANSWVAAEAFVGPGVTLHEGAVLGARGVTTKDLPAWSVSAGNPARFIRERRRNMPHHQGASKDATAADGSE